MLIKRKEEKTKDSFQLLYANLMILLMTFFIVLVSLGTVEKEKLKIGFYSFREALFSGGTGVLFGKREPVDFDYLIKQERIKLQQKVLKSLRETLEEEKKMLEIIPTEEGVALRLPGEILFDLGRAELKDEAKKILDKVAEILKKNSYPVRVEGHTDNLPIRTEKFPSNWELSAARAINTVKYLEKKGVERRLLSAVGYGEYRPLYPNDTPQNRALNRRVEIVIILP